MVKRRRRDMPSPPLDSTQGRTTSGMACYYLFWAAQTVGRRLAWHAIIALGRYSRMTSRVACHNRLWKAHIVGRRWAWHAIISSGQHTPSDGVTRGMPSLPLCSTNDRPSSGVACHHSPWTAHTVGNVGQGNKSPPLDSTHGQTTSSMA